MKRIAVALIVIALPALLCFEVWEIMRYKDLRQEVALLEKKQEEWLEKNKKILAAIAVLKSPARIRTLAEGELGLEAPDSSKILKVEISRD